MLGSVATLAACKTWIAGVPSEMRGDTPMRVTNWTDKPVCKFGLTPADKPVNHDADWLGKLGKLQPGETRVYNIKPGDYWMTLRACDDKFLGEEQLHVTRPLALAIGRAQERPMRGYLAHHANVHGSYGMYRAPVSSGAGGEESGGEAGGGDESGGEESGGGETAAAPSGPACKGNGVEVDSASECCSGYTEQHGTLHNGGHSFCCGPSSQDCHSTEN